MTPHLVGDHSVLDTACQLLRRVVVALEQPQSPRVAPYQSKTTTTDPTLALATALVGLLRNLSANNDVKTMLFGRISSRGGDDAVVVSVPHAVVQFMTYYPHAARLQKHACGWVAAVTLRQPHSAATLIQNVHMHTHIVTAMQRHSQSVPLQRQAALALRNLVSRASHELKQQVLDEAPTTEYALRHVAGQWLTCQDEVYAALRDLGFCPQPHSTSWWSRMIATIHGP